VLVRDAVLIAQTWRWSQGSFRLLMRVACVGILNFFESFDGHFAVMAAERPRLRFLLDNGRLGGERGSFASAISLVGSTWIQASQKLVA
jgi:hypothetical protein